MTDQASLNAATSATSVEDIETRDAIVATIPQQMTGPALTFPPGIAPALRDMIDGLEEPLRTAVIACLNVPGGVKITNGNAKGGVMKTTLSVYFALILALTGENVLLVDADDTNRTALKWQAAAGDSWPASITVVGYTGPSMHKNVTDLMAKGYKHLVIDVGPTDKGVLKTAWSLTKRGVVPTQQHVGDIVQLTTTFDLLNEMGEEIDLNVLIARSFPKRLSYNRGAQYIHELISGQRDYPEPLASVRLLEGTVPFLEPIADTWGVIPDDFAYFSTVLAEALGVPMAKLKALENVEA